LNRLLYEKCTQKNVDEIDGRSVTKNYVSHKKPVFESFVDLQKLENFTSSRNKKVPITFCVPPLQCPLLFIIYLNGSNSHFFFLLQMLVHYPVFYFPVSLACIFLWFLGLFSFFDVTFISKPQFLFFLEQLLILSHHFYALILSFTY
jgi:hypothetical protein